MTKLSPASILAYQRSKKKHFRRRTVSHAASKLGRMGGLVGGNARADILSDKQRSNIASHAAKIRWGHYSVYKG